MRAIVRQAKLNDFEFRKWYVGRLGIPWNGFDAALQTLSEGRRYYVLLFSHEFAHAFWREGSKMTFVVPNSTFQRIRKDGTILEVPRRGHIRRAVKPDAWRYHLKAMVVTDDPLLYIRRFLLIEEDLAGVQPLNDDEGFSGPRPSEIVATATESSPVRQDLH